MTINSIGYINKTKLQESIIIYCQILRFHCFKGMSPGVFPFVRIFSISLINKDNGDVIPKATVTFTFPFFFPKVFPISIFVIIPSKTKVIHSLVYILHFALITSEQIYNAFVIAVKTMVNNILFFFNSARVVTFCHIQAYLIALTIAFK